MNKYESNCITKTCRKNNNRNTWIIKENTHEPIIEKAKYDKVQEIKQSKKGMAKVKHEYLLRDLLYCGQCKRKLQYKVYRTKDKQRFLYEGSGFNCSFLYKKDCKNNMYIREKDINSIVRNEVVKYLSVIESDKIMNKFIDYYKANREKMQEIKEYKKIREKLERRKSILYKQKCEQYITIEQFKTEYTRAKKEIENIEHLIMECESTSANKLKEERIQKIITEFKGGNCINNAFLKKIINRIEVHFTNKIEIIFFNPNLLQ